MPAFNAFLLQPPYHTLRERGLLMNGYHRISKEVRLFFPGRDELHLGKHCRSPYDVMRMHSLQSIVKMVHRTNGSIREYAFRVLMLVTFPYLTKAKQQRQDVCIFVTAHSVFARCGAYLYAHLPVLDEAVAGQSWNIPGRPRT